MRTLMLSLLLGFSSSAVAVSAPELYRSFERTLLKRYVNPQHLDLGALIQQHRAEMQEACNTTPGCPSSAAYPAIRAVMQDLQDGHANFLTPEQNQNYRARSQGSNTGFFGFQSSKLQDGRTLILDVVPGGPASLAGLSRFDVIEGLDSSQTKEPQEITVTRQGKFTFKVTLTPKETPLVFLPYMVRHGTTGVLRIPTFLGSGNIASMVHDLVARASDEGMTGMVVDLRGNGGGRSDQCMLAALAFNPRFTEEWIQVGWKNTMIAEKGQVWFKLPGGAPIPVASVNTYSLWIHPAVFLVDERSASCAEFMAFESRKAALTWIFGEKTYGVGNTSTVLYNLPDQSALQLSILYVQDEEGKPYPASLTPDVVIQDDPEKLARGEDPLLEQALQFLEMKIHPH
ncbi:S41 family peptidase [Deinococcus cellulosilyticus]|uniref:Protease n=1 Tax=Deinococcus cellulosilyticus (strain DSM 18568 / NBRC 106333 / KACC 11606 / 5516J-15) TaxID=1223518 RepID=A0A511NAY3_DEIC1|nr:S41 family peptidase [Deinococcus cellulosilyticus]GEM49994.1 protease [Deinococcus cellulosilyticus NBRC 106333 = KACC 11606]